MNLPNKLTVLRVIMVPFFVFFMLTDVGGAANKWIALIIFCVASLTDMLDGKIARARNLVTNFGFCHDLSDSVREFRGVDRYRNHCERVHYQRIQTCGFG